MEVKKLNETSPEEKEAELKELLTSSAEQHLLEEGKLGPKGAFLQRTTMVPSWQGVNGLKMNPEIVRRLQMIHEASLLRPPAADSDLRTPGQR